MPEARLSSVTEGLMEQGAPLCSAASHSQINVNWQTTSTISSGI